MFLADSSSYQILSSSSFYDFFEPIHKSILATLLFPHQKQRIAPPTTSTTLSIYFSKSTTHFFHEYSLNINTCHQVDSLILLGETPLWL